MIRTSIASCPESRAFLATAVVLLLWAGACSGDSGDDPDEIEDVASDCNRDTITDPATAEPLTPGQSLEGYVCPLEDEDWYRFEVPASDRVLSIGLGMAVPLSAVEPTYAIWSVDGAGAPIEVVAQAPGSGIGERLQEVHCVDPGPHTVVVRDEGNDSQDLRHAYDLIVTTEPDPDANEPNQAQESAVALSSGVPVVGAIACRGDEDWFRITVTQGLLVQITFTSPIATYEPTVRLFNTAGELQAEGSNPGGRVSETALELSRVGLPDGDYFIVVTDDDGSDADPKVPYSLAVSLINDVDDNEPNDNASEATPLATDPVGCGGGWTEVAVESGTIGSPGDDDWFRLPLAAGCQRGVVEAELVMNTAGLSVTEQWDFNIEVQATVALIRPHIPSPCAQDEACTTLNATCNESLDCAGLFDTCLPEGLCAGATACLPEGSCGAIQTLRRYTCSPTVAECQPASGNPPPPNEARLSAPLLGDDVVYFRVSDFQSDGSAPETLYTLRVRVRSEPDDEPDNTYVNELTDIGEGRMPRDITARDCTGDMPDCCGPNTWIEGSLSYDGDVDWFQYPHPCPGEDCMVRILYEVDGGPVDFVMSVHRGNPLWFTLFDNAEQDNQQQRVGALGGLGAGDSCFYAFQGHQGEPFLYRISVRDLFALYPNSSIVRPQSRDWNPDQTYRFCVEKIADVCQDPCIILENGECDRP